ncbi:hypothetical protein LAZ40_11265 [Cereibacter sphaeroides]|uniref:hypothetical protein n=1 Tax=Cereibacter sphaeroides TaxID=1063 RepID=UPI001F1EB0E9|nr:hypothetical protein [Cereibacter sphaeroides]MCE6959622.1 hypothetical protein [Cereibacter sphaeroides]MCE6974518.1 hypothetical protein [Cereibacter sphaeroides]
MKSIELKACDLARKSGFGDGDLVSWFIESLEDCDPAHRGIEERVAALDLPETDDDGYPGHTGDHRILVAAVRKHLAPLLPGVGIIDFSTSHNPVRAEVQDQAACAASDVSVTIDVDALLAIIAEIEAEPAAAPLTVPSP